MSALANADSRATVAIPGSLSTEEARALRDPIIKPSAPSDAELRSEGQTRIAYWLARVFGDRLLYAHDLGCWFEWDGRRWAEDITEGRKRMVLTVLEQAFRESITNQELKKTVSQCQSANAIDGILRIAQSLPEFAVQADALDADPYLLNVGNGTLDLKEMRLRPHDPADRLTRITRGDWEPCAGSSGRWDDFLQEVLPDDSVRHYFRAFAGMSLCGAVREQTFTIATGTGANGKSVAYNAILHALGDYGHSAESSLFMHARGNANAASPALFGLRGKRLVVVSETERDQSLALGLMKSLTGGDPITARPLYGSPVTFKPTHTPLMVTNHLPQIDGADRAVWRRVRVIPFDVTVPVGHRDPELGAKLEDEATLVLSWALSGWAEYLKNGHMPNAEKVMAATDQYRQESDIVARFISENCVMEQSARASVAELYGAFTQWVRAEGVEPLLRKHFVSQVEGQGFKKRRASSGFTFRGLGLLGEEER